MKNRSKYKTNRIIQDLNTSRSKSKYKYSA